MLELEKMSLANLGRGAAVEHFDRELEIVLANIADPNTKTKVARKVTLVLTIVPSEDRSLGAVEIKCSSALAPCQPVEMSVDLVQEGRRQSAYQRKVKTNDTAADNVRTIGG